MEVWDTGGSSIRREENGASAVPSSLPAPTNPVTMTAAAADDDDEFGGDDEIDWSSIPLHSIISSSVTSPASAPAPLASTTVSNDTPTGRRTQTQTTASLSLGGGSSNAASSSTLLHRQQNYGMNAGYQNQLLGAGVALAMNSASNLPLNVNNNDVEALRRQVRKWHWHYWSLDHYPFCYQSFLNNKSKLCLSLISMFLRKDSRTAKSTRI